ncbi:DUF1616 domain-containing protein [Natrarchaeobius halalkaliphilus]|uniref:DUF1616 domain-containing protein n=1 Tax=Natrarchaeobius halalkaliphilus TaxID=1679091 RepID=A0A3N6LKC9_9EURY|nr:DUF1616 domain-containing protein [Natrarchaeobius halalkaliphilus]RQG89233.1 DUF1616 domain-containing protein [Natrarchaeobius halalkaliphilus]
MNDDRSPWQILPRSVRIVPADLTAVLAITVVTNVVVFFPFVRESPLRHLCGLVFLLFVPGYTLVCALFPEASRTAGNLRSDRYLRDERDVPRGAGGIRSRAGIDLVERIALSVGSSLMIVPVLGLLVDVSPWPLGLESIMFSVTGFVVCSGGAAAVRRLQLPPDARFRPRPISWSVIRRSKQDEPETRTDTLLNLLLIASIAFAVGIVTVAVVAPAGGEEFSSLTLLTEDDDGDLVAGDYPSEIQRDDGAPFVTGVTNQEHRTTAYTVVVVEQRAQRTESNGTVVTDQRELERFETELGHGESWYHEHEISPTMTGEVRVVWLLYPGDVPAEPSIENTEYRVHLWLNAPPSD